MLRRMLPMLALAILAAGLLAACGSADEEEHPTVTRIPVEGAPGTAVAAGSGASPAPVEPGDASPAPVEPNGATPESGLAVVMGEFFFEPATFSVPADTEVTIAFANEGAATHDFTIDELEIHVSLDTGGTTETVVNLPAGEYEFYCSVPGHKESGMTGTLTVN